MGHDLDDQELEATRNKFCKKPITPLLFKLQDELKVLEYEGANVENAKEILDEILEEMSAK